MSAFIASTLSFFFLVVSVYGCYLGYLWHRPMLLMFFIFAFMYLSVRPLLLANGLYINYSYTNTTVNEPSMDALILALIFQFVTVVCFLLGYQSVKKMQYRGVKEARLAIDINALWLIPGILIYFGIVFIPPLFYFSFSLGLILLVYSIHIFYYRRSMSSLIAVSFTSSAFFVFLILFSDDRRDWLVFLLVFLLFYCFLPRRNFLKIISYALILLFLIIYISIAFRTQGIFDIKAVVSRLQETYMVWAIFELETDFSIVYDDFVLFFDSSQSYPLMYGMSFLKPFVAIIPREIFPDKLETTSRLFSLYFNPEFYYMGGSEPTTLWGEVYWNFHYFGSIFFFFCGMFFKKIDLFYSECVKKMYFLEQSLVICLAATTFHILRGPADTFWLLHFFLFLSFVLVAFYFSFLKRLAR